MKLRLVITICLCGLTGCATDPEFGDIPGNEIIHAQEIDIPPKELWRETATIQEIETRRDHKLNIIIQSFQKNDNGMNQTDEESREFIKALKKASLKESEKWQLLKSKYRQGDEIVRYEIPSSSDSCGYLLVRNNEILVNVVINTSLQSQHETHMRSDDPEKGDKIFISEPSPVC